MKKYVTLGGIVVLAAAIGAVFFLRSQRNIYHGSGYSVRYPENWQIMQFKPVDVAFVSPGDPTSPAFRSNINIIVTPGSDDISTTSETFKNIIETLDTPENAFTVLDKRDMMLNGNKCTLLQYNITSDSNKLKGTLYLVEAGKTYIFSYTTLAGAHEKQLPAFKAMLESFEATP
jgi:hypothetical protein